MDIAEKGAEIIKYNAVWLFYFEWHNSKAQQ